jgi:hypothetical protein
MVRPNSNFFAKLTFPCTNKLSYQDGHIEATKSFMEDRNKGLPWPNNHLHHPLKQEQDSDPSVLSI